MNVYFPLILLILSLQGAQSVRIQHQELLAIRQNDPLTWYKLDGISNAPTSRQGHSSVVVGDKIIVFGGCHLKEKCFNDLLAYDIK